MFKICDVHDSKSANFWSKIEKNAIVLLVPPMAITTWEQFFNREKMSPNTFFSYFIFTFWGTVSMRGKGKSYYASNTLSTKNCQNHIYTAESKTNRPLGSVWSKISTFHIGLVFRKVISGPRLVYGSRPLLRPFKWGTVWCFISRGVKTARS